MTTPSDILERLQSADEDEQGDLIVEAAVFAEQHGWITADQRKRIANFVHVGAYHDAALTLVPEGYSRLVAYPKSSNAPPYATVWCGPDTDQEWGPYPAATEALALCIAALKARMAMETSDEPKTPIPAGDLPYW